MDSYENGWPFSGKDQVQSLVLPKTGLVNLSIGTDGRLYLIQKDLEGNEFWQNQQIWVSARLELHPGVNSQWKNLGNIAGVGVEFLRSGRRPGYDANLNREGVWFHQNGTPFDTRINLSDLPNGHLFAIDFSGEHPQFLDGAQASALGIQGIAAYNGLWDDLAKFVGSFIEAVVHTVKKVVMFVAEKVEEGIAFTIHFLEESVHCVVKFAEQAMQTINMVLKKYLGIDLEKIMPWLGFIFDADYIHAIQSQLVKMMNESVGTIKQGAEQAETKVTEFFDKLKNDIEQGMVLFTAKNDALWTALENNDQNKVRQIFAAHGTHFSGAISVHASGQVFRVEDEKHTFIVNHDGGKPVVRCRIAVPKDVQGMTLNQYQQSSQTDAETHMGKTPEEKDKNKQTLSDRQESLKCDPVLHWPLQQVKQLPSIGTESIGIFNVGEKILGSVDIS